MSQGDLKSNHQLAKQGITMVTNSLKLENMTTFLMLILEMVSTDNSHLTMEATLMMLQIDSQLESNQEEDTQNKL